jgi:hypothetical protein
MNSVDKILEQTQYDVTIFGVPFKLRLITAEMAAQVIGNKTLGLVGGGASPENMPVDEIMDTVSGYLGMCMVSPRFGETSDPETDTISLLDLSKFAGEILSDVFKRSGFERVGNSNGSSEDTEEGT